MPRESKPKPSQPPGAPPEPNEEVIESLLAQFVARQNARLSAEYARRSLSDAAVKARGKRASRKA